MTLKLCSLAARGLWIEMLAIMGISEKIGYLQIGGRAITPEQLAIMAGISNDDAKKYMQELEDNTVFSRDENGIPYSRRMAREAESYKESIEYGKKGGNPNLKKESRIKKPEVRSQKLEATEGLDESNKGGDNPQENINEISEKSWKTSYEVYLKSCMDGYNALKEDAKWLAKQQKFNPNVDILLSLEKAVENFWGTEAGWKNKKSRRSKDIDWKSTLTKTIDMNKVFLPRNGFESPTVKKPLTPDAVRIRDINDCQCAIERAINSEPFDEGATSRCLKALNDKYEKNIVNQAYEWVKNNRKG